MHLHQLQHLLVFKTKYHTPIFIWYPLIWRWIDFTYSTNWINFVTSTKNRLINQFIYHIVRHWIIYPQGTWPITSIPSPGEWSQVLHHRPVLGGNQGFRTMNYSYCHQMGHLFNSCPFFDDRLRQLFREEVMNIHQPIFPTTIVAIPNLSILGTQAMNPSIGHMVIHINY
jgi:hypothetical protein